TMTLRSAMVTPPRRVLLGLGTLLAVLGLACQSARPPDAGAPAPPHVVASPLTARSPASPAGTDEPYVRWLVEQSMLYQAGLIARRYAGQGELWQHPYAVPQPRAASALAPGGVTAYPAAPITRPGQSVLQSLGDSELWRLFRETGITALHTGPMKRAGGLRGREFTPTVDGNFDRISTDIDPALGTVDDYTAMVQRAREQGAVVIGDIVPGHSGKGADFRLAERRYADYPGLYHMVEIAPKDWSVLPAVPAGQGLVHREPATVDELKARRYNVGQLPRTIFCEKGVKESDWSATDAVVGVDGVTRRWVYLHYFKEGQPTFNWLDPSFAAPRLVAGDALHS